MIAVFGLLPLHVVSTWLSLVPDAMAWPPLSVPLTVALPKSSVEARSGASLSE